MDNTALINTLNTEYEKLGKYIDNLINTITDDNQDAIKQVIKKLTIKKIQISKDLKLLQDYDILVKKLVNQYK